MLVVIDSFTKFMWTYPLKEKAGRTAVPAIRSLFMTNGPSLILHTDNGREFCNDLMTNMLSEFEVRHVRGRARCPWIQGQVERANQTIKWMIASMLLTLELPGKWNTIREDATYSYNMMRHSTTGNSPFTLMHGLPIRQLMSENVLESVLYHHAIDDADIGDEQGISERDETILTDNLDLNNIEPVYSEESIEDTDNNIDRQETTALVRESARRATRTAVDRMVRRSTWRNDFLEFTVGTRVLIRPDLDANESTRIRALYEHLSTDIYIVIEIIQFNRVKLAKESDRSLIIENIDIIRLRKFGNEN